MSDVVNPANGSVSLRIQVPIPQGRGITLPFSFNYDSNGIAVLAPLPYANIADNATAIPSTGWLVSGGISSVSGNGGWSYGLPIVSEDFYTLPCIIGQPTGISESDTSNYVFKNPTGGRHAFPLVSSNGTCKHATLGTGSDDKYLAQLVGIGTCFDCYQYDPPVTVSDADGTVYFFQNPLAVAGSGNLGGSLPDGVGNIYTVSNPHRSASNPSDGTTTYTYDALGRMMTKTNQDGSTQQWNYNGNTVTDTDEASHPWKRTTDAFRRLTQVLEPDGSNNPTR